MLETNDTGPTPSGGDGSDPRWWRRAVIYQAYIRSFADGDGDGIGDIAGLRSRLGYLADLGVDAVWVNPWYPSPMADAGYDVSDYRAIEPVFGTLPDAEALIGEAHRHGLRVLLDIVPNHTSDRHVWFVEALASPPGSAARRRYIFRDGRGPGGDEPPNDWESAFGGPAWTRVAGAGDRPGQWYLHLFAPAQPDLEWTNPEVRADFEHTLRFWFDRGVDGFRIDVAHGLAKDPALPDVGSLVWPPTDGHAVVHPFWDRDDVHGIFREWRTLGDSYDPPRVFVGEAWVAPPSRLALYVRPDELQTVFNFDFLLAPWQAEGLRAAIGTTLATHDAVGAAPTWVLSNHDVAREVSRYARPQGLRTLRHLEDLRRTDQLVGRPADLEVGRRRARAAALLMLALPGSAYVYQGEELGLAEVEDLPDDVLADPTWFQSGGTDRGRDGCRVPIPWSGTRAPYGFSPPGATAPPWLPQPAGWGGLTVEAEAADATSMLHLYSSALRIRRAQPALGDGPPDDGSSSDGPSGAGLSGDSSPGASSPGHGAFRWLDLPAGALGFERAPGFACIVNVDGDALPLPDGATVLLASGALEVTGDAIGIPVDTTVWLAG